MNSDNLMIILRNNLRMSKKLKKKEIFIANNMRNIRIN